jgi:hypothetical protein
MGDLVTLVAQQRLQHGRGFPRAADQEDFHAAS